MMTATGRAATRVMACSALRPPASISTMAVTPSTAAQNSRCQTGERAWPREAMLSTTKAPESAEVTKNTAISTMVSQATDRKSTRLNSSHLVISYAVFCLKKKKIGKNVEGHDLTNRQN